MQNVKNYKFQIVEIFIPIIRAKMSFEPTYTWSELLDINSRWWNGEDIYNPVTDLTNSTQEMIFERNPHVSLLAELNQYVITIDSQDGSSTPFSERKCCPRTAYHNDVPLHFWGPSFEYQRVYVDFYADRKTTNEIRLRLENSPDIGYRYYDYSSCTFHTNATYVLDNCPDIHTDTMFFTEDMTDFYLNFDRTYHYSEDFPIVSPHPLEPELNFSDQVCEWNVFYKHWGALKDMEYHLPKDIYSITPIDNPENYVIKSILGK